jgi:hypothetical protein
MCTSQNLGPRVRRGLLRVGVLWHAVALGLGFGLVEWGVASSFGFVLAAPLAIGIYCLLAGSFGVCFYTGMCGERRADHGAEVVAEATQREQLMRRGMTLAGVSCALAGLATMLFVVSL